MTPELQATIEDAYRVFAPYALTGGIKACRCPFCVDAQTERQLIATPLREIAWPLLAQYTHSAHEWDERASNELRHFLPRYFELIAAGTDPCYYGNCLGRLANANYRTTWPGLEADAIDAYFVALFRERIRVPAAVVATEGEYGGEAVEAVLCLVAGSGSEVRLLLDVWETLQDREANLHLANMIVSANWVRRRLEYPDWRFSDKNAAKAVIRWLLRSTIRARLEEAFIAEADPAAAALLSHAEGIVGRLMRG